MKCWVCDGLGVTYKSRRSAFRKETCTRCNGTGEIQTNEELFDMLSTEEKAKRIINIAVNSDCDYRKIVGWLKQPH